MGDVAPSAKVRTNRESSFPWTREERISPVMKGFSSHSMSSSVCEMIFRLRGLMELAKYPTPEGRKLQLLAFNDNVRRLAALELVERGRCRRLGT